MPQHTNWQSLKIFTTRNEVQHYLNEQKKAGRTIGFVATMGALHQGHISLIHEASKLTDCVVCSIFVNPTQFNDPADLEKYPRPIDADINLLKQTSCEVLFNPGVKEIYPEPEDWHIDLGSIENILEGKFRPGHYQGVTQVVNKLFNIIKPDLAFFGQKDFQQCMIISKMTALLKTPLQIYVNPIIRDEDGLALSSRNVHLSLEERKHATILSKTLFYISKNFDIKKLESLKHEAIDKINQEAMVELDYFEILNSNTLEPISDLENDPLIALVAAKVGKTRLIDNIILR